MKTLHQPHPGDVVTATSPASPWNRRPSMLAGLAASCLWVCSLGIGLHPLQAAFWGVYHLPHLEQLDFDGDQVSDLAMIQNGELWLRFDAARQTSDWQRIPVDVPFTPFQGGIRVASGDLNHDGFGDLAIAASGANRVLVVYGQRDRLAPPDTQEINVPGGPTGMDLLHSTADGSAIMSILAMETPEPYVAQVSNSDPAEPLTVVRSVLELGDHYGDAHLDYLTVTLTDAGPLHVFWLHQPPANGGIEPEPVLSWFGPVAAQPGLTKWQDITLKRGYTSATPTYIPNPDWTPAILLWGDGLSELTLAVPSPDSRSYRHMEQISMVYEQIGQWPTSTNTASSQLLVTRSQGRELAIYQWSETVELELVETLVAPDGKTFLATAGLSDGGLATLLGPAEGADPIASPVELGIFALQNGRLVLDFQSALPAFSQRPVLSRVVVYDRDPFADNQARELESLTAGDWARNAQISDRTVTVLTSSFIDPLRGLGADTLQTLPLAFPPPRDAFALANQWEPDSSLFFGAPPAVPGSAAVLAQPPAGSHPGPVELRFMTDEGVTVVSRVGNGAWLEGDGPYAIGQTALVEYYGVDATGRASPRQSGRYIITQATHTPEGPLLADTDGDGLDDAWERLLFGGLQSSPDEDPDGDGFTTGEEYLAGTDPRDPESRPDGEPTPPLLLDMNFTTSGRLTLSWPGLAANQYGVDISTNLVQWSRSSAPTEYRDGAHHWEDPDPLDGTKFYRVERLP